MDNELLVKLAKLQLQFALINGDPWAIKHMIEKAPTVIVNNNNVINFDPEIEMTRRGIPIPKVNSEDI